MHCCWRGRLAADTVIGSGWWLPANELDERAATRVAQGGRKLLRAPLALRDCSAVCMFENAAGYDVVRREIAALIEHRYKLSRVQDLRAAATKWR
jgi:hypothetical protein